MVNISGRVSAAVKAFRGIPSGVGYRVGGLVRDWYPGSWQQNRERVFHRSEQYYASFASMTLIAGDISKLPITVQKQQADGTWKQEGGQLKKLIDKPNGYQTRNQFVEYWILSKLMHGNTYVLKQRGKDGVAALKILDPTYVTPMVTDSGEVYYQLATDHLSGVKSDNVTVPASEIVHDRFNCLYHPLVGLSPLYAASLAAKQGLSMQKNSVKLFDNGGQSPGILTAPGQIGEADADRIKLHWETNYGGSDNAGKVAVLGSGLEFKSASITSVDAQLIEQLKWTAEVVAGVFHVPPYMIGVGSMPNSSNVQALILQYYSQCLQVLIEALETCLDDAVEADESTGYEADIESLLRMDGTAMATYLTALQKGSILTINEARRKLGMPKVEGGDSIFMQQQNYSLEALIRRDSGEDPFGTKPEDTTEEPPKPEEESVSGDILAKMVSDRINARQEVLI